MPWLRGQRTTQVGVRRPRAAWGCPAAAGASSLTGGPKPAPDDGADCAGQRRDGHARPIDGANLVRWGELVDQEHAPREGRDPARALDGVRHDEAGVGQRSAWEAAGGGDEKGHWGLEHQGVDDGRPVPDLGHDDGRDDQRVKDEDGAPHAQRHREVPLCEAETAT